MRISQIIDHNALVRTDATAVVTGSRRVTFGQLRARAARLANAVAACTELGDRVAILSRNRPEYLEALYGIPSAGRTLLLLNYRLHPKEWSAILSDADARVLLVEREFGAALGPLLDDLSDVQIIEIGPGEPMGNQDYDDLLDSSTDQLAWVDVVDSATACIIYTSGTTGFPKGAMISHHALATSCLLSALMFDAHPGDRLLACYPMCHASAFQLLAFHVGGAEIVCPPAFDAEAFFDLVEEHRPTKVSLAPTMARFVVDLPRYRTFDASSIDSLSYGGMPMPLDLAIELMSRFGNLRTGFGQSESTSLVTLLSPEQHRRALSGHEHLLASCGTPAPFNDIAVLDDANRPVPIGDAGELCVRSDLVMTGYWHNEAATADALAGGWLHTGDLARMDDEGYVYLVDRKKDMVISGGQNVYPREVEMAISSLAAVAEVAVVGLPDPVWGERVTAYVICRPESHLSAEEVVGACADRLAGYKKPREVRFVEDLPRTATGKVLKSDLRARL